MSTQHASLKTHRLSGRLRSLAAAALILCPGCRDRAVRDVWRAGGQFQEMGLGFKDVGDINFDPTRDRLTDEDLARLQPALRELRPWHLNVAGADLGDGSIDVLQHLPTLRSLDIRDTRITRAGAAKLRSLPRLRHLRVDAVSFDGEALRSLREALPRVEILRDWEAPSDW